MITATVEAKRSLRDLRDLYGELHSFGLDLRGSALKFQEMVRRGAFPERGSDFTYNPSDRQHALNRSIDITRNFEFMVATTGAFSSGKSTLLNLLLETPDLLPSSVIPLTAVCTVIRHGDAPRFRVRYVPLAEAIQRVSQCFDRPFKRSFDKSEHVYQAYEEPQRFVDGEPAQASLRRFAEVLRRYDEIVQQTASFDEREPFIAGGGVLPDEESPSGCRYFRPTPNEEQEYLTLGGDPRRWVTREWLAMVREVTLWTPSRLLENNIVFLDLPGLNCKEDYHRRAIQHYCNMADCILVTAFQPGNQADEEILRNFKNLSSHYKEKIFFAFNKVDQFVSEPQELVRAVDYLARDTIGADFPRERFFLTSGQLARCHRAGDEAVGEEIERLRTALSSVSSDLPGLGDWVRRVSDPLDPGGIDHLKESLYSFLINDAFPSKLAEVAQNYKGCLDAMINAASPSYEQSLHMDASDILRKSVLDYFRHVKKLARNALYHFRFDYLRGPEGNAASVLREDLKTVLDQVHSKVQEEIRDYFNRPILSAPLRDDPVSEFDLQIIADEASEKLRRDLQELVTRGVQDRVRSVFRDHFARCDFDQHFENLFKGAPECRRHLEGLFNRVEETMLHSLKVIVRNGFFYMPRGRELKRLERTVPMARMKELLVEVFCDFYPSWVYEHIYSEIMDHLWLSLFLDCEDLEEELGAFFRSAEGVITGAQAVEQVEVPQELVDGQQGLYRTIRMCQDIDELVHRGRLLAARSAERGVAV